MAARGRPIFGGNTVRSEIGTLLRGATMALDGPGTPASKFATDANRWMMLRSAPFNLNVVRLDIRGPKDGGPPRLSDHYADLDRAVECAAAAGMYLMLMQSAKVFAPEWDELREFWTYAAPRYKDRTHVLYEMTNEPGGSPKDFSTSMLTQIRDIYNLMHNAAPNTLIGVLDYAYPGADAATAVAKARTLQTMGVQYGPTGKAFVATHLYFTPYSTFQTMKDAFPTMATEHVYGGPGDEDEVNKLGFADSINMSWVSLCGRWGLMTDADDPYGASIACLRDRILPGMHNNGRNWSADVIPEVVVTPSHGRKVPPRTA